MKGELAGEPVKADATRRCKIRVEHESLAINNGNNSYMYMRRWVKGRF